MTTNKGGTEDAGVWNPASGHQHTVSLWNRRFWGSCVPICRSAETGRAAVLAGASFRPYRLWGLALSVFQRLCRQYFDCVATACEVASGKPAPDIYLKVAKNLSVDPADCVVFEDVPAGIQAGKAAGMTVIAVYDDFSSHMEQEKRQLADRYIDSFLDLFQE